MISNKKYHLTDVLSVLTGLLLSHDTFEISDMIERLTGRLCKGSFLTWDLDDARRAITKQHPELLTFTRIIEHDDLWEVVKLFNKPEFRVAKDRWAQNTAARLGTQDVELAVPLILDLAYNIIKTMSRGESRLESIQQYPFLNGYTGLATSMCIKHMMKEGVIEEGNEGFRLRVSSTY